MSLRHSSQGRVLLSPEHLNGVSWYFPDHAEGFLRLVRNCQVTLGHSETALHHIYHPIEVYQFHNAVRGAVSMFSSNRIALLG
jgi:hypothetical protein